MKKYKTARDLIYDEKNTFLTKGHRKSEQNIRGADGRMASLKILMTSLISSQNGYQIRVQCTIYILN